MRTPRILALGAIAVLAAVGTACGTTAHTTPAANRAPPVTSPPMPTQPGGYTAQFDHAVTGFADGLKSGTPLTILSAFATFETQLRTDTWPRYLQPTIDKLAADSFAFEHAAVNAATQAKAVAAGDTVAADIQTVRIDLAGS